MEPRPLSAAQESIWLEQCLRPEVPNAGFFAATIRGPVSAGTIRDACLAITIRHPVLRGTVTDESSLGIVVHPAGETFTFTTHSVLCEPGQERQAARAWQAAHPREWDLRAHPPIAFSLLLHGAQRQTLIVHVHHIGFDGRSKFLFARDFTTLLRACPGGAAAYAAAAPDLAGVETLVTDSHIDAAVSYWLHHGIERLSGPVLPVPDTRDDGVGMAATPPLDMAAEQCAKLEQHCRQERVSFFAGLMSCLGAQLWGYGNPHAVLAISVDTSTQRTRERIGLQVNVVPCIIPLADAMTFRELLRRSGEALDHVRRFRHVPFHWVLRRLRRQTGVDVSAGVFSALSITYLHVRRDFGEIPGLTLEWDFFAPNSGRQFDLVLQFRRDGGAVYGRLDYARPVFDAETADAFMTHFASALTDLAAIPGRPLRTAGTVRTAHVATSPTRRNPPTRRKLSSPKSRSASGPLARILMVGDPEQVVCVAAGEQITISMIRRASDALRTSKPESAGPVTIPISRSAASVLSLIAALSAGFPARAVPEASAWPGAADAAGGADHPELTPRWVASHVRGAADLHAALGRPAHVLNLHPPCSEAFAGALVRGLATCCRVDVPPDTAATNITALRDCLVEAPFGLIHGLSPAAFGATTDRTVGLMLPMTQFLPTNTLASIAACRQVALCLSDAHAGLLGWSLPRAPRNGRHWALPPVLSHPEAELTVTVNGRAVPDRVPGLLSVSDRGASDRRSAVSSAAPEPPMVSGFRVTPYRARVGGDCTLRYLGRDCRAVSAPPGTPGRDELEWLIAQIDGVCEVAVGPRVGTGRLGVVVVTADAAGRSGSLEDRSARAWRRAVRGMWPAGSTPPQQLTLAGALPRDCHGEIDRTALAELLGQRMAARLDRRA